MKFKDRLIKIPQKSSCFLMGVRGSGKTALLKKSFPDAVYIDLLNETLYRSYLADISQFYEKVSSYKKDTLIIVDEIQKLPALLNEVHRLIEESARGEASPRRFILTGSSARKLKAPGVNLLAGRAGELTLHPFTPQELGKDFNLAAALEYGQLPVIYASHDKTFSLKGYVNKYLKEEIKAEALVRNLPGFTRFLEVAGLYHGQTINMSAIARDCQISRQSVQDFFSILEDTMLGFFLSAYSTKLKVKEKKHKKFYFIDPGLVRTMKNNFGPVSIDEKGSLFEGLVAQILRAYNDYGQLKNNTLYDQIYYWSPAEAKRTEVDFLLKKGRDLIAIEVKSSSQVFSKDYKGLKAIHKIQTLKKRIVVYLGAEVRKTKEGIDIWPFDFFCKQLAKGNNFESSVEDIELKI